MPSDYAPSDYLDLYDFRRRVTHLYAERDRSLQAGEDAEEVARRFRAERIRLFATHPQSALGPEDRRTFAGLPYFAYNPQAVVAATVHTDVEPYEIRIDTGDDEVTPLRRVAELRFVYDTRPAALSLFWINVYGGGLFLPFRDATAPAETYGGGRYLIDTVKGSDVLRRRREDDTEELLLDFNYAYNPSCAYNPHWVCPLAPAENVLDFPIRAGERVFHGAAGSA